MSELRLKVGAEVAKIGYQVRAALPMNLEAEGRIFIGHEVSKLTEKGKGDRFSRLVRDFKPSFCLRTSEGLLRKENGSDWQLEDLYGAEEEAKRVAELLSSGFGLRVKPIRSVPDGHSCMTTPMDIMWYAP